MKYQAYKLVLLLLLMCSCQKDKSIKITGIYNVTSEKNGTINEIYFYKIKNGSFVIADTIQVKDKKINYVFDADSAMVYGLGKNKDSIKKFYFSPGEEIDLTIENNGDYAIKSNEDTLVTNHFKKWNDLIEEVANNVGHPVDEFDRKFTKFNLYIPKIEMLMETVPENEQYKKFFSKMSKAQLDMLYLSIWITPIMVFPEFDDLPEFYKKIYQSDKYKNVPISEYYFGDFLANNYIDFALNYRYNLDDKETRDKMDSILVYEFKNMGNKEITSELALKEIIKTELYGEVFYEKKKIYEPLLITDEQKKKLEEYIKEEIIPHAAGVTAPNFRFLDKDEREVTLNDFKGKPVYIDFWATWCPPCREEIPHLERIQDKYGNDINIVSISVDKEKDKWKNFIKNKPHNWSELYGGGELKEKNKAFFDFYKISGIPRFVLIDKEGKLIMYDAYRPSEDKLKTKLDSII